MIFFWLASLSLSVLSFSFYKIYRDILLLFLYRYLCFSMSVALLGAAQCSHYDQNEIESHKNPTTLLEHMPTVMPPTMPFL